MADFFKGWRRKIGCGLLSLAVLMCAAWGTSTKVGALAMYDYRERQYYCDSFNDSFSVGWYQLGSQDGVRSFRYMELSPRFGQIWFEAQREFHSGEFRRCGLMYSLAPDDYVWPSQYRSLVVQYWIAILPLILLSAVLLLWPQRKNPAAIANPKIRSN